MRLTHRSFPLYLGLLVVTVALGLATRQFPGLFPAIVARFGGDVLWAAMVFWLLALVRRTATTGGLAIGALAIACVIELTQLFSAPWIDALRATRVGALVLGHGFLWSDIASYAVGVALAVAIDARVTSLGGTLRGHPGARAAGVVNHSASPRDGAE